MSTTGGMKAPSGNKKKPKKKPGGWTPSDRGIVPQGGAATKPTAKPAATTPAVTTTPTGGTAPPATAPVVPKKTPAQQIAWSQIQPQLGQFDTQAEEEKSASQARQNQLTGWTKWYQDQLNSAFGDTRNALNTLITSSASSEAGAQDALASALRGGAAGQQDLASQLGAAGSNVPPGQEADILNSALNRRLSGDQATRDLATAEMAGMGNRRSLAGTELLNLADTERRRSAGVLKGINTGRQGVLAQLPGLEQVALKDQRDYAIAKKQLGEQRASRLFQQWLSTKELSLKTKELSFSQWLSKQQLGLEQNKFTHQKEIDWATVGINQQQANNELARIEQASKTAKTKQDRERLQARGESIAKGLEVLSAYMAPQAGEGRPGMKLGDPGLQDTSHMVVGPDGVTKVPSTLRVYHRTYDDAMRKLMQFMSRSDALRQLKFADFPSWRRRADQEWDRLKRRGAGGYTKGSGRPD